MAVVHVPYNKNPKAVDAAHYSQKRGRPFLFQVTDPVNRPLYPYLLALHANPTSVNEKMAASKTQAMTYGGYVEWNWPDELDSLSCEATTGAFIGPEVGLTAGSVKDLKDTKPSGRQATIAWERHQDLLELFRQNGMVYNGLGQPILRGRVMCIYDRGIFVGHFTSFNVNEDDTHAFSFQLNWEFKVEQTIYKFPQSIPLDRQQIAPNLVQPARTIKIGG